jgi:uncharacterized protein (DUF2267 family)
LNLLSGLDVFPTKPPFSQPQKFSPPSHCGHSRHGSQQPQVAAQLPHGLKRLWHEDERPGRGVAKVHETEFVGRVRRLAALPDDDEADRAVKAVFATLQRLLGSPTGTEGEAWDVFSVLPKDLKRLWLAAVEAETGQGGPS